MNSATDIGEHLYTLIKPNNIQYFISLKYNIWDKGKINKVRLNKLRNINEVGNTHLNIKNFLTEAFKDISIFFFIEQNEAYHSGDIVYKGHYHSHILLGNIKEAQIIKPSSFLRRTLNKTDFVYFTDDYKKPYKVFYDDCDNIVDKSIFTIKAVLSRLEWLRDYKKAVDVRSVYDLKNLLTKEDKEDKDGGYLLKQIKNMGIDKIIDFQNSTYTK
ncbi:hypothetical protein [Synechococcus sp. UW140]|uniref:hypothetical protein n=1 Tax=Synechococcus sp. UW140 TaxID=368503 RepID=UPI0025FDFEDC|nr:hypothetical protein [Synechococcus sp. UW140]